DVWAYTGFTMEQLLKMAERNPDIHELLAQIDVLIDGPFLAAQKDLNLVFRGSANQRLLDVPATLAEMHPVGFQTEAYE
ncbi:MAG TPA: 4Fe-4S cluster-binding domain-containing protein, partial [Bacillota bacterium]|nr:4Fe-4S cluster-binding domain-containing protein [Bacillota bacterium]